MLYAIEVEENSKRALVLKTETSSAARILNALIIWCFQLMCMPPYFQLDAVNVTSTSWDISLSSLISHSSDRLIEIT